MAKTTLTAAKSEREVSGWTLAEELHLPAGATYTSYIHNDTAYWMLDAVRETAQNAVRRMK